jgi:hypothetical protein
LRGRRRRHLRLPVLEAERALEAAARHPAGGGPVGR